MAKKTFTISDFSPGTNGYVDPLDIEDGEVAQSICLKTEPGVVKLLGDMKLAHTPATANANTTVEPGYGLFSFAQDYDKDGNLGATNYLIMTDGVTFDAYDDGGDAWVSSVGFLGGPLIAAFVGTVKPCFFIADGAVRISSGNFAALDSGGDLKADGDGTFDAEVVYGGIEAVVTDADFNVVINPSDTIVVGGQEMIALVVASEAVTCARNMTGLFPAPVDATATDDAYVVLDPRWYGVTRRNNFAQTGTVGVFSVWSSTYQHPRPPVAYDATLDGDALDTRFALPFLVSSTTDSVDVTGNVPPSLNIGLTIANSNSDSNWEATSINIFVTALYDEIKQESQPHKTVVAQAIATGIELAIYLNVNYANAGDVSGQYLINNRVTGARIYYEDIDNDPGNLYQLVEVDFEKGCKKAGAELFKEWNQEIADEVAESHAGGELAGNRTTAADDAFIFVNPFKAFTYEMNTGYPPDVNIHARYKTAVIANNRLFAGNVYQSGRAHGDRMISSPIHKYDILPEMEPNVTRITAGDGDEIIKLEAFSDRVLQFKKRTLYIINVSGGLGEDFVESQHKNMGVENPSQTCMTEYGVAWVNSHGVFTYDGQDITDITIQKLQMTNTTDRPRALNVTESNIPLIGYHPGNKWLIVHPQSNITGSFEGEAWIYDFKSGSWSYSSLFTQGGNYKTNMVWATDNNLLFFSGTNSSNNPNSWIYREPGTSYAADNVKFLTKEYNLGIPGVKKKLRSVYVTFSASDDSRIEADIIYKHPTGTTTDDLEEADGGSTYYTEALGFKDTSGNKRTVELVPTTYVSNAYTFQIKLHNPTASYPNAADFQLYDITFVYRPLGTR